MSVPAHRARTELPASTDAGLLNVFVPAGSMARTANQVGHIGLYVRGGMCNRVLHRS